MLTSLFIIEGEDKCTLIMQHLPPHFFLLLLRDNQAIGIYNGFSVECERDFNAKRHRVRKRFWGHRKKHVSRLADKINRLKSTDIFHEQVNCYGKATSPCTTQGVLHGNKYKTEVSPCRQQFVVEKNSFPWHFE